MSYVERIRPDHTALLRAITLLDGQTNAGKLMEVTRQTVDFWLLGANPDEVVARKGSVIPIERVIQLEALTEGRVTREEIMPEVYRRNKGQDDGVEERR